MTRSLVTLIIHSKTYFAQKVSIRKMLGGNTILLVKPNPYFNTNIILFVSYAMVYTGTKKI